MNIFEVEKKLLKTYNIDDIDKILKELDEKELRNIVKLILDRLTPEEIKINRIRLS